MTGMKTVPRSRLSALMAAGTCAGLLLAPATGMGESRLSPADASASASVDIRIVVPPYMRVLENSHSSELAAGADGTLGGEQRLVVVSTMRRGFCVTLRLAQPGIGPWQLNAAPEPGVTIESAGEAWRLCSARPGRYTLNLQHRFAMSRAASDSARPWPIQTDITAI